MFPCRGWLPYKGIAGTGCFFIDGQLRGKEVGVWESALRFQ